MMRMAAQRKRLLEHLCVIAPRQDWPALSEGGTPVLLIASEAGDAQAARALLQAGADPDCETSFGYTSAYLAAGAGHAAVLTLLLAAEASVHSRVGFSPLDYAVAVGGRGAPCVRVLLENGVRLKSVHARFAARCEPWMHALDAGWQQCTERKGGKGWEAFDFLQTPSGRDVVVTLLGLKRRRGHVLNTLDRFVVREIGKDIYFTRTDAKWQR